MPRSPRARPDPTRGGSRFDRLHASQRIAYGTAFRAVGEVLAKPASLVFYVVMARELGQAGFGVFNFALSLASILLILGGLGLQERLARELARDADRVDTLVWNVLVLKGTAMLALLAAIGAIAALGDYSSNERLAIVIVAVGVGFENLAMIVAAVFQAFERQHYIATSLLANRLSTAAVGIGALLLGGGLVVVSLIATLGSALGLGIAYALMVRRVVRPKRRIDPGAWGRLIRTSVPLGGIAVLGQSVLRSSVVLVGLLAASTAEVGDYSAAFRLIEATLFISWSFSSAALPWFSRHPGERRGPGGLSRAFELALKVVISAMLPLALLFGLYAEPLIEALYGAEYSGAIEPLRILAAMTVLWGVNGAITAVLIGRDRPRVYVAPALVAIVLTIALALVLIPEHGALGAALTTVPAAVALTLGTIAATTRIVGRPNPVRVLAAPALAGLGFAAATLVAAALPWVPAALLALAAYGIVFLAVERSFHPDDFGYYARIMGGGRPPAAAE